MAKKIKQLSSLTPNPKNPRTITPSKLQMLQRSLEAFGDLSGIVENETSNVLIGGHQRLEVAHVLGASEIVIERTYEPPTKVGTTAEGYVILNGERHAYRRVRFTPEQESAANIAANQGAGRFDIPLLAEMMRDLRSVDFDLDLTMFGPDEREGLFAKTFGEEEIQEEPEQKKQKMTMCPSCGHEFSPGDTTQWS